MQSKGSVLLVLLIALLFASAALLQLSEDNYLAHLIAEHVDDLSQAHYALDQSFKRLSASLMKNQACYSSADNENALKDFWSAHPACQVKSSGLMVHYAFRHYQREKQEASYMQYTLYVEPSYGLQIIVEENSGLIVSWVDGLA